MLGSAKEFELARACASVRVSASAIFVEESLVERFFCSGAVCPGGAVRAGAVRPWGDPSGRPRGTILLKTFEAF